MHRDASGRQRESDAAGADPKLEHRPITREPGEKLDYRVNHGRFEHLGGRRVVPRGHLLSEMVLGHRRSLPAPPAPAPPL